MMQGQSNVSFRDLVTAGGVSNSEEGSPVLERIKFPTDSTSDMLPEDSSEDQSPEDWGESNSKTRSAPKKSENTQAQTLVIRFRTLSVLL